MTLTRRRLVGVAVTLLVGGAVAYLPIAMRQPSNDRTWARDQAVLPHAEIEGPTIRLRNIRNIHYRTADDFDLAYYDRIVRLDDIQRAWFLVVPFAGQEALAHTFVSFGLRDGTYVAVSIEIRKEVGEAYSPLRGLFREYEIMYVVGDERDLIGLRTNFRRDDVYLYPIRAPHHQVRRMFTGMLARVNHLARQAEFYNTLTNNCTSNLARHVNDVTPGRVPFSWRLVLPGYSDRLAYDLGLIDTALPFDAARDRFRIGERARGCYGEDDFSACIRHLGPTGPPS